MVPSGMLANPREVQDGERNERLCRDSSEQQDREESG